MIEVSAPVRICDVGGWTDTWFGGPGKVLNIAVTPGVRVSVTRSEGPDPVFLDVQAFGDRYPVAVGTARRARHALLEAAIDSHPPPEGFSVEIRVDSAVPPGCGTGTSSAVAVALIAALATVRSEHLSPRQVAYSAHRLEVDLLGMEGGVQDQLCAALGGISYIEVEPYPEATVTSLPTWKELGNLLSLVFLTRPHDSSEVHRQVIEHAKGRGSHAFSQLRQAAESARRAVIAQDIEAFGSAMIANTEAQRSLHPGLVGADATRVIETAVLQGAAGYKVNGAGGDGGSVTLLSRSPEAKEAVERLITELDPGYRVLPVAISYDGLQIQGEL